MSKEEKCTTDWNKQQLNKLIESFKSEKKKLGVLSNKLIQMSIKSGESYEKMSEEYKDTESLTNSIAKSIVEIIVKIQDCEGSSTKGVLIRIGP